MKTLSIRQTLVPESMWDNIYDWCDICRDCPDYRSVIPEKVDLAPLLKALDNLKYP